MNIRLNSKKHLKLICPLFWTFREGVYIINEVFFIKHYLKSILEFKISLRFYEYDKNEKKVCYNKTLI